MLVLFQPDYPDKDFYTIVSVSVRLGYFATLDPTDSFDFTIAWQDRTWVAPCPNLAAICGERPILNRRCLDISKRRVETVFKEFFGYSSFVDPIRFHGRCIQKYDENAVGGSFVECPVSRLNPKYVYQKYIDARQGDRIVEYRVPIVIGSIPLTYVQHKDIPRDKIKTATQRVQVAEAQDSFNQEETRKILAFCRSLGLHFGELDVIRSNVDVAIYVLDANKTPGGFGMCNRMNWDASKRRVAIDRLSQAFDARITQHLPQQP